MDYRPCARMFGSQFSFVCNIKIFKWFIEIISRGGFFADTIFRSDRDTCDESYQPSCHTLWATASRIFHPVHFEPLIYSTNRGPLLSANEVEGLLSRTIYVCLHLMISCLSMQPRNSTCMSCLCNWEIKPFDPLWSISEKMTISAPWWLLAVASLGLSSSGCPDKQGRRSTPQGPWKVRVSLFAAVWENVYQN